jgi:hypothetical protein
MLNNETCFLDDPIWTDLLKASALSDDTFGDRSRLAIEMMMIKCKVPKLTKRTNHAVLKQAALQSSDFEAIASDLRMVRSSIMSWRRTFNVALLTAENSNSKETADYAKRFELLGISLVINIVASRLLVAIVPYGRAFLEEEVQNLAMELKELQASVKTNRRTEFFLAQKAAFADAAIATHAYFDEVQHSGKIIESWRLEKFFETIGRKCCDGETCCDVHSY